MDNNSTENQIQLQELAHEVCRSHSARPDRDLYRICPSKLSKRELEDLYFALLESNLELKRTLNSQNDKLKMLSTKVQRLSASKSMGSKDKDSCHSKTLLNEQKDSITELKKCNERMAERIRVLNMRLCSAKQFLKKQPEQKNTNKSQLKNSTNFQQFKKVCDHSRPHQAAIEYKISKSVETSTDNPLVTGSPKQEESHVCNENKCRTAIEELQQKISNLQEELHNTQINYASKLHNMEDEIRAVMEENVRARADTRAAEERGDELVSRLRAAEGRRDDLETQLAIEKRKVKELETRLKLADNDKNLAKSLEQLTVINEQRETDQSPSPSYKFHPRKSISQPKNESEVESAVSYYKPEQKGSEVSVKSVKEPKRDELEVESLLLEPSQKNYPRESQVSVKIKEPMPQEYKIESHISVLEEEPSIPPSTGQRKKSIAVTELREFKIGPEFLNNGLEERPLIPSSKGQRNETIAVTELEVPTHTKPSQEVKFPKSDDSGYTDINKSFDVEPEKDEEMLRINRELLKKIADLKSQLDLLTIAAAGAKHDEPAPTQLKETKPFATETKTMEDRRVSTKSLSTQSTKVPNKIEPKQQVQAKIKSTPSSVKPKVVQNVDHVTKQLANEDNLPKRVPYEDKEQTPLSYKDQEDNFFASENLSPSLGQKKSLADEKSPILYEDHLDQPIPYEIQVPRNSLYPELKQKAPPNISDVKSQLYESSANASKIQEVPTINGKPPQSSYEIIEQRPWPSDEKVPMLSSEDGTKQSDTIKEKMPTSSHNEETSKNLDPYQKSLSMPSPFVDEAQKPPSIEYETIPRESRSLSYHPYGYKSSFVEEMPDPTRHEGTLRKSQLYDSKKPITEEKAHKEYVDKKRESLFYKDQAPSVEKHESLSYEKVYRSTRPYEDKIYPDEQKSIDDRTKNDEYLTSKPARFERKRRPSLYAERIENFSLDDNAPTTSSPYEEKMKKLTEEKLQISSPPEDDMKNIRFESYIHMAESGSRDYEPSFDKYIEPTEDGQNNLAKFKRRKSSTTGTSKPDDHNGFQIPGPIPSTLKPTPVDRKKHRPSLDKTKKRASEEKTVTILEDDKELSGYSIYFDKISMSKNESTAISDYFDDDTKNYRKEMGKNKGISVSEDMSKPKASTDFLLVNQDTSYSSKTMQVDRYVDTVPQGNDLPPSAMQEQGTQVDQQVENLQAPAGSTRRNSATYTQSDDQPQTYNIPKDANTQPRYEFDQKTYTQNVTYENPQHNAYKKDAYTQNACNHDTYTQVGPQDARTPRYSRSTSPDNTEKEISSLPDLPQERETRPTHGYLSPGEKATMTFTDNETNTDYGSLSEGELPSIRKATKSYGEKGVETTSRLEESPMQRMEDVLKSISEEISRCHQLLASQKRDEHKMSEVNKPEEDEGVQLRASQGARRLTGARHVCVFTLHVGTLVLSDEAVIQSRDKSLVLMWRFYDQSVTMTRVRQGRVVLFDFSTEYDVVFSEDFLNYMKYEKMPLLVCEITNQEEPFATCSLPLRDALLHVNRRADMSLALTGGPGGDPASSAVELGVLDLWCLLRCDAVITQHLTISMSRQSPSNLGIRSSYHRSVAEEDLSNERMSEDLELSVKKDSRVQDTFSKKMPFKNKKSYSGYLPPDDSSRQPDSSLATDELSTSGGKISRRRSSIGHPRLNMVRKDVSFDASSNWAADTFAMHCNATGLIPNAVPSNIRSTEEMKAALESEEAIGSLEDLLANRTAVASDRRTSQLKYERASVDKKENELSKKYNDISKLMGARMDAAKKSVRYSDDDEQPQRIQSSYQDERSPQSIEITVLWLALNEECDAMVNPNIKRLYVAYKFLGRNGAELETPVSLPKPKHYVDKCFFNFKKTFHLHDADLPALGHMARLRAGSRVSTDPRDCLVFTVVSEPPEDPLGLSSCEDVGYAYLYLGDILAYSSGYGAYTEVVAVHAARGSAVCGVLAVKIDGLHVLRRALTLSHSAKDLMMPY